MKRLLLVAAALLLLQGCTLIGIRNYELLSYNVLVEDGDFQVRQYQDYVAATVTTAGIYEEHSGEAHGLLFDYISGENAARQKIAMTAPVLQKSTGEKIAMTAPVIQKRDGSQWTMSFILPSTYTLENAPRPLNPRVVVQKIPGGKVAVVTYSGNLDEASINANTAKLLEWTRLKDLKVKPPAYSAGYDPPWTLPWLKRNEILIDLE